MLGPIFAREWRTVPRRGRHYVLRTVYIFALWVVGLSGWQAAFGWGQAFTVGDAALFGTLLFQALCFLQLTLVLFFSGLLAASAVAQEKDRGTLTLLLVTDLTDWEIVVGKFLGSLLHVALLLLASLPVLAALLLLGGVGWPQVVQAGLVLVGSGLGAGSLGALIAFWRDRTFQSLVLTVLGLVLYVLAVELLEPLTAVSGWAWADTLGATRVLSAIGSARESLSPYRALAQVMDPETSLLQGFTGPLRFVAAMVILSLILSLVAVAKLRVWNPRRDQIVQREESDEALERLAGHKRNVHAAPGKPRRVWANPILWREVRTRGYGRRPILVKLAFLLVFGLIVAWIWQGAAASSDRLWPAWGLTPVLVLCLLIVNAQAVTSVTSERDGKSLELLLVSDLSPREFVLGKLLGTFYNCKEIVLPTFALIGVYYVWGFLGTEGYLFLQTAALVLALFAAVLGLHIGLRTVNSRVAIGLSQGAVFFLFVGSLLCLYLILISGQFEYQWTSFIFFLAIGIGGLLLVLGGERPSVAITVASWICPLAVFYAITNILVGNPHTAQASDPLWPFLVLTGSFGFAIAAMLIPMLSEFEVAFGYSAPAEE